MGEAKRPDVRPYTSDRVEAPCTTVVVIRGELSKIAVYLSVRIWTGVACIDRKHPRGENLECGGLDRPTSL